MRLRSLLPWCGLPLALAACDSPGSAADPENVRFVAERGHALGIDFRHHRCGSGEKQLLEMNGGAVTVLDFDQDGHLDLFFSQGAGLPGFNAAGVDLRDRLYRNDGAGKFADVTDEAGCSDSSYTFSAAAADYDGDGDPDLLLCNYGPNRLLRNDAGRFVDVTAAAGIQGDRWSSCAAFADFDRDGDLDFYVGNYVEYDLDQPLWCGDEGKGEEWRSYCHPDQYPGERDALFENRGDGTFREVTEAAGMIRSRGKALGLLTWDYDSDGDVDLFVANDSTENFLWQNQGELKFQELGAVAGVAVNLRGLSEASMGTDCADIDADGDLDLFVTHLAMETNTLYRNDGDGFFTDRSFESGLGEPSLLWVGFGTRFFDLDHDADEDVIVVNGHVVDNIALYKEGQHFAQPAQVYYNEGDGRFRVAGREVGPFFAEMLVGRAFALWDPDDDGDLDAVVVANDGEPIFLQNQLLPSNASDRHWFGVELSGVAPNTQAIGARLVLRAGGRVQVREQRGASSYNSWHDPRIHFGLASATEVESLEIQWPRGGLTQLQNLAADQYLRVEEGDS